VIAAAGVVQFIHVRRHAVEPRRLARGSLLCAPPQLRHGAAALFGHQRPAFAPDRAVTARQRRAERIQQMALRLRYQRFRQLGKAGGRDEVRQPIKRGVHVRLR
jgi:hypothetical protein